MFNLLSCEKNKDYKLVEIKIDNSKAKLELKNLMIDVGNTIKVIATNYGKKSILIKSRNVSFGIDSKLAEKIFVSEAENE